jgi:4-hydroxy-tetrahydrodipicolinate synthase/2-dehydro-3-deoxy-phosphogluconate/2-dehydro-3-deoxy-6-phosphogalactonate aldolase
MRAAPERVAMSTDTTGSADPLSLGGIVPPTVTTFDADEAVDHARTAAHARFVVDRGASGVFPLGTNGEFAMLDAEERHGVVESVVGEVGGEVPVIAGVGAPSTHRTVRNAERAAAAGADGLVVVTPYYYPPDPEGIVEHYRRVAEAVPLPIYVYQFPQRTGTTLSLDTLASLAGIEGVAGCKDSSGDVAWLARAADAHPELTFLVGSDVLQLVGREVGCAGGVSAVANAFPGLLADLHAAYDAGERDRARGLQRTLRGVRAAFEAGPYMAGAKAALSLRGFDAGGLRSPLRTMNREERDALEAELRELGVL